MIKIKFTKLFSILAIFLLPVFSHAITLEVQKPVDEINSGDVVVLNVYLNSDEKEINSVEGKIKIEGNYEIKSLSTAGSIFELWPNRPSYNKGEIEFVGGSTAGVYGSSLKMFSIAIEPKSAGSLKFSNFETNAFLNDGKGTSVAVSNSSKQISVGPKVGEKNELVDIILNDKKIPNDFKIEIGRDTNLFDGKLFASFNTSDDDSGINRYEIVEDDFPSIRTGNTYVLRNQEKTKLLTVKAIDNAGNIRVVTQDASDAVSGDKGINWFVILIATVVLVLIKKYAKKFFKK